MCSVSCLFCCRTVPFSPPSIYILNSLYHQPAQPNDTWDFISNNLKAFDGNELSMLQLAPKVLPVWVSSDSWINNSFWKSEYLFIKNQFKRRTLFLSYSFKLYCKRILAALPPLDSEFVDSTNTRNILEKQLMKSRMKELSRSYKFWIKVQF